MFNTRVIMPGKQGSIKDLCRMLWLRCFDDTEEYTDYYFDNRWNKSITILSDNVSMLHLNPYDILINGRETGIYYIVGVCTLEEYRRRGYMDSVLKKALEFMYKQGKPFTYLMPASEEIYKPYGFTGIYPVRGFNGEIPFKADMVQWIQCKSICIPYNMLKDRQKAELIKYTGNKLAGRFTCYPVHNKSYFKGLYEEMRVCGGDILTFWDMDKNTCLGYIVYLCEEIPEIIESVFEKEIQREILTCIKVLGFPRIKIYETNFWNLDCVGTGGQKNYLMARIVDLKAFVECIYTKERQEMWLEVSDGIISGNNGRWHIITGERENICHRCENTEDGRDSARYTKCTIEELEQKYFSGMEYFLNELV